METIICDVCVIGCGPSGFVSAMRLYDFGRHVCIVEGSRVGGAGVHNGALSSKTMWELAKDFAIANRVDRGYRALHVDVQYKKIIDSVFDAVREKEYQMLSQIETFSKKEEQHRSLRLVKGWARFTKEKTVVVEGEKDISIKAKNYIIATGSIPRKHPFLKIDGKRIITSDHILTLKNFPKEILIVGAGIVGCEFATIFAEFRQTKVHLLDSQERVIPFEDDDVSNYASNMLEKIGVKIHHKATLREIKEYKNHIDVVLDYKDGHSEVISVDTILISIGRVPNTKNLGLENIGITTDKKGVVPTDENCMASSNVYAVGDVSGHNALVSVAEVEGRFAAKAIEGKIRHPLRYKNMPTIMFFNPEISAIGLTEKEAQERKIAYRVVTYSHALVTRAIAMRETGGFFKMIVTNEEDPHVLGMRAAGMQSAAVIMYIATLMDHGASLGEIMKTVHPHPSMTEGIVECIRILLGKSIYKAEAFPKYVSFKSWTPKSGYIEENSHICKGD